MTRTMLLLLCALVTGACSAADKREPVAPTMVPDDPEPDARDFSISRGKYEAVLKEGLQHVMRWYFVKPHYQGKRFLGYEVADVLNEELRHGPLRVGDVLLSVNGSAIERPEHAMAVWRGLWTRKTLELKLLRKGRPRTYVIPIVDKAESE